MLSSAIFASARVQQMNLAPCGAQRAFNLFPTDVLMSSKRDFVTSFLTGLLDDGVTGGRTMYFFSRFLSGSCNGTCNEPCNEFHELCSSVQRVTRAVYNSLAILWHKM